MKSKRHSVFGLSLLLHFVVAVGCEGHRFPEIENREQCFRNLREIHRGIAAYKSEHLGKLPDDIRDGAGKPLLSWRVRLLPYLGHEDVFDRFDLESSWDSLENRRLLAELPSVFHCPNVDGRNGLTSYRGYWLSREHGLLNDSSIQCLESGNASVLWTKPEAFGLRDIEKLREPKMSVHGRRYFAVNDQGSIVVIDFHDRDSPVLHVVESAPSSRRDERTTDGTTER